MLVFRVVLFMSLLWSSIGRIVLTTMETKSPYFSPKRTRNFTKKHGLGLLQKVTQASKAIENTSTGRKPGRVLKSNEEIDGNGAAKLTTKKTDKGRARVNIRTDVPSGVKGTESKESCNETTSPQTINVKSFEQEPHDLIGEVVEKNETYGTTDHAERVHLSSVTDIKIKVELLEDITMPVMPVQKTPIKQEPTDYRSPMKRELEDRSESAQTSDKETKWEPENWRQTMANIREMRRANLAPVDTMGCDQFAQDPENMYPDRIKRYHCLVSLVLSSQTKDQANHECMLRLKKHGLTPESIVATDSETLQKLIYPVGFYKNKTKFIKEISQILIDQYAGDIPNSIEGLLKLPGVGKKMAHLCMRSAWNIVTGIGVDTHVHRIANWLKWVPKETKTPEETRVALEKWLPYELWDEVNHMLVGFGQTICTSRFPRCNDCRNAPICPARGKQRIRSTPVKKEIKLEDLEF